MPEKQRTLIAEDDLPALDPTKKLTLAEVERTYILQVLEDCSYNQTRTAEVLDIDRVTLHNKLKKYGWSRPRG